MSVDWLVLTPALSNVERGKPPRRGRIAGRFLGKSGGCIGRVIIRKCCSVLHPNLLPLGEGTAIEPIFGLANSHPDNASAGTQGSGERFSLSSEERVGVRSSQTSHFSHLVEPSIGRTRCLDGARPSNSLKITSRIICASRLKREFQNRSVLMPRDCKNASRSVSCWR
jgi:hypothetical protein